MEDYIDTDRLTKNFCKFVIMEFDASNHELLIKYQMLPRLSLTYQNDIKHILFKCLCDLFFDTFNFKNEDEKVTDDYVLEWVCELKEHMTEHVSLNRERTKV